MNIRQLKYKGKIFSKKIFSIKNKIRNFVPFFRT